MERLHPAGPGARRTGKLRPRLEKPNALTIAWTGITCSDPPMTYISVRPERYSYDIIKKSGEFVINLTSGAMGARPPISAGYAPAGDG